MEHTYVSRRGEPEVFFSIMDDRDQEILRLAARGRKLREVLAHVVRRLELSGPLTRRDVQALDDARDLLKEE